jgi:hypothetical protein
VKHRSVGDRGRLGVQRASEGEGMRRAMADVEIDMHAESSDGMFEKTRNETAVSLR